MQDKRMQLVDTKNFRKDVPHFSAGDTVRVHWKIKEGDKERTQPFEGVVLRRSEGGTRASFTVRKVSYGIGVERIFPLHSPRFEKIDVVSEGQVRRARLYYLRNLQGKAARIDIKDEGGGEAAHAPAPAAAAPAAAAPAKS
jgi:large subunit ribosomal protein L19